MANRYETTSFSRLIAPILGVVAMAACSGSSGSPAPGDRCTTDAECGAGERCVDSACEAAAPVDAGTKAGDSAPTPPSCATALCGGTCCASGESCQNGVCTAPPTCHDVECSGTCCSAGETCQNGACKAPCSAPGESCSATSQCCQSGTGVQYGAVCISNDGACHAKCTSNSECTSGCCAAVQGESYGVCAQASDCQTLGGIGDACSASTSCASGDCTGLWCTAACSPSNNVCAGGHGSGGLYNEYGQLNWCVVNGAGADTCFPGCNTSADCAPYAGTTCKAVRDVTGYATYICSR